MGLQARAMGGGAHAMGLQARAIGGGAHAMGLQAHAVGEEAHGTKVRKTGVFAPFSIKKHTGDNYGKTVYTASVSLPAVLRWKNTEQYKRLVLALLQGACTSACTRGLS